MLGLLLPPHPDGLSPPAEAWHVVTVWGPCELRALLSPMALREGPQLLSRKSSSAFQVWQVFNEATKDPVFPCSVSGTTKCSVIRASDLPRVTLGSSLFFQLTTSNALNSEYTSRLSAPSHPCSHQRWHLPPCLGPGDSSWQGLSTCTQGESRLCKMQTTPPIKYSCGFPQHLGESGSHLLITSYKARTIPGNAPTCV